MTDEEREAFAMLTTISGDRYQAALERRVLAEANANGCCGGPAWRGRVCPYHEGMLDGIELALREADSTPPACEEWVAVVSLPRDRYRVRETADGWEVLTKDDHGAFS